MSAAEVVDAVVVGAGHNGLVAATLLADAGWDVVVLEATPWAGGAVRSRLDPGGFVTDRFSAFYPLTAASPVMRSLALEDHGLRWRHAPTVLAHLRRDAPGVAVYRDPERTAAAIDELDPGDGTPWRALQHDWERWGDAVVAALLSPFPPVRASLDLVARAGTASARLVRRMTQPVASLVAQHFGGEAASLVLTGNALHADVVPRRPPSGLIGWLLTGLAQGVGFPVPEGGAGALSDALVARLRAAGGDVRLSQPVQRIEVVAGRAVAVQSELGRVRARRAVLVACDVELLYRRLLAARDVPASVRLRMSTFRRGAATVKVNYHLRGPVPWSDPVAAGAGTVHVADDVAELATTAEQLVAGRLPERPFLLVGQMTTADPTRSPPGTESLWVYTRVPQELRDGPDAGTGPRGPLDGATLEGFVARMQARLVEHAPGFEELVVHREVQGPHALEAENPSLVGGDLGGGSSRASQQLVLRPYPGLGGPATPIRGLYLASSSAHPGPSVHGACGANAARQVLARRR